jgi:hypothetical protein
MIRDVDLGACPTRAPKGGERERAGWTVAARPNSHRKVWRIDDDNG